MEVAKVGCLRKRAQRYCPWVNSAPNIQTVRAAFVTIDSFVPPRTLGFQIQKVQLTILKLVPTTKMRMKMMMEKKIQAFLPLLGRSFFWQSSLVVLWHAAYSGPVGIPIAVNAVRHFVIVAECLEWEASRQLPLHKTVDTLSPCIVGLSFRRETRSGIGVIKESFWG